MNRDEVISGARAGLLAAASTAGALVAIGGRTATASRPFNIIASHLLGPTAADMFGFVPRVTLVGLAIHAILTAIVGVIILGVVRRGLAPLWLTTTGAAVLCALLSIGIARRGGLSLAELFPIGDVLVYYLILGLSLGVGIRVALPPAATR